MSNFSIGDHVKFVGFSSDDASEQPDNADLLNVGDIYEIVTISVPENEGDEESYVLGIPNDKYNPEKRKTKNNKPFTHGVDVWAEEIEEAAGGDAEDVGLAPSDVKKGETYTITDEDGPVTGSCYKKTRKLIGLIEVDNEGNEDHVDFAVEEITRIEGAEAEPEPEPEPVKTQEASESETKTPATARAAKGEDLKGIVVLEDTAQDETILAMIEDAESVDDLVVDLAEEAGSVDYNLGGALYNVWLDGVYKTINDGEYDGDAGFERYVEEHIRMGYRKALYLMKIYSNFRLNGISADVVKELGWSKSAKIAENMTEDNADALVDMARESTVRELGDNIKEMRAHKGEDTREVVNKTRFKFGLVEERGSIVQGYIEQAAEMLGMKSLDDVFEHIVSEWAQTNLEVSATKGKRRGKRG